MGGGNHRRRRSGARARCGRRARWSRSRRRWGSAWASRSDGSSGWSRERSPCSSWSRACRSSSARASYDVDLSLAHERIVAGDGVTGEIVVRNHGRRIALPGRHRRPRRRRARRVRRAAAAPRPHHRAAARHPRPPPRDRDGRAGHHGAQRPDRPAPARARLRRRPRALRPPPHDGAAVDERGPDPRPRGQPDPAPGRLRHVVPRHPRVRAGRLPPADPLEVDGQDRAPHGPPVRGVPPLADGGRARRGRGASTRTPTSSSSPCPAPPRSAFAPCATPATSQIVTGSQIPRVVRGRLRAITHIPVGIAPPDARRLQRRRAHREHDAGRRGVPPHRRVGRAASRSPSWSSARGCSLTRLQQAALAFPADTAVVAVICDERAHPRMQPLSGLTVLTVGTLDDLAGLLLRGATS